VGEVGSFGCGTEGQFWTMNGAPQIVGQFSNSPSSPNQYFTTTNANGQPIFTAPATGAFTLQKGVRDSIYGPGLRDWNLGLFKKFAITERHGLEFRAEAFDVDNHANWTAQTGTNGTSGFFNPTSSTFGKVTAKAQLSRNLQISLRYSF
jgi:hypothetical protein